MENLRVIDDCLLKGLEESPLCSRCQRCCHNLKQRRKGKEGLRSEALTIAHSSDAATSKPSNLRIPAERDAKTPWFSTVATKQTNVAEPGLLR